jgi:hypothetical protein
MRNVLFVHFSRRRIEAPNKWVRSDLYKDFLALTAEMIAEQDAVLLGRKMYDER